jgi:hypothetical protein
MHIYVNGVEQSVYVTSGSAYPNGNVARGNEFYIGHDSVCVIDEVSISTIAITQTSFLIANLDSLVVFSNNRYGSSVSEFYFFG